MKFLISSLLFLSLSTCRTGSGQEAKIVVWTVKQGELESIEYRNEEVANDYVINMKKQKALWRKTTFIFPEVIVNKYISKFEIMTDGADESLAGVNPNDETNQSWTLAIDFIDVSERALNQIQINDNVAHTLIHELGHIITLNHTQVEPTDQNQQFGDDRYLTMEGLATVDSYINAFVIEFWQGDMLAEWDQIQKVRSEYKKLEFLETFHSRYKDGFVTEYASESPEEDIAECWFEFVAGNADKFSGRAKEKVIFFDSYPELVNIKNHIRNKIKGKK